VRQVSFAFLIRSHDTRVPYQRVEPIYDRPGNCDGRTYLSAHDDSLCTTNPNTMTNEILSCGVVHQFENQMSAQCCHFARLAYRNCTFSTGPDPI